VTASYGFALAGGYAVQAHGFLDRPSADVDLFAEASAEFNFSEAVDAVIAAYQRDGLNARAEARSSSFDDDLVRLAAEHDPGAAQSTEYPTQVSPNTASTRQARQPPVTDARLGEEDQRQLAPPQSVRDQWEPSPLRRNPGASTRVTR
jgi:hypothetical protein